MLQSLKQEVRFSDLLKDKKTLLMGILNITPDSFSDGGKYFNFENAIIHAKKLIEQGINIIDIGGESTRPGAAMVSEEEELRRVISAIKWCRGVARNAPTRQILISIDTYKSNVARKALEAGADMINDVSGLTKDSDMVNVAREFNCPIVIMHNNGIPASKPDRRGAPMARPDNFIQKIYGWLKNQTTFALTNGIKKENIIIDPGIGFGKTPKEDLALIENLKEFKSLGFLVLVGLSRKSFIRKLFPNDDMEVKSKELTNLAIKNGADIVRVHEI